MPREGASPDRQTNLTARGRVRSAVARGAVNLANTGERDHLGVVSTSTTASRIRALYAPARCSRRVNDDGPLKAMRNIHSRRVFRVAQQELAHQSCSGNLG